MSTYYAHARTEILPHLPARLHRGLELGCGEGVTLAALKEAHPLQWIGGVELAGEAAKKAQKICTEVWVGDAESLPFHQDIPPASLDLILCMDVLEHLVDPWAMVKKLSPLLTEKGRMIISIPNVRNLKFIRNLLFKGDFIYRDAGLLDRTHLRFFTRTTAIELACCGGLTLVSADIPHAWKPSDVRAILTRITGGRMKEVLAKQWLIVVEA